MPSQVAAQSALALHSQDSRAAEASLAFLPTCMLLRYKLQNVNLKEMLGCGIGSASALQTRAVNDVVAEHKAAKDKIAQKQEADCANVKQRHASGIDRHGMPLKRTPAKLYEQNK